MTSVSSDPWLHVGKHTARFEPPDVVHLRPGGDVSIEETLALIAFLKSLPMPSKRFIGLVDMSQAGRQDPATAKHPDSDQFMRMHRAQVFYNATFYHRTLVGIFVRVAKVLKPDFSPGPVVTFETEVEARAWIDEYRKRDGG
jgi:hypothetical protein